MSARDTLTGMLWDNYSSVAKTAAIDAYRDEVREEVAAKIRSHRSGHAATSDSRSVNALLYRSGLTDAAYIAEGVYPEF